MFSIVAYILLSLIKVLIKSIRTISLVKGNSYAPLLAGINALLAANLIKLVVELDIISVCIIAFLTNVVGTYISINIFIKKK